jgi:hypothetical protein
MGFGVYDKKRMMTIVLEGWRVVEDLKELKGRVGMLRSGLAGVVRSVSSWVRGLGWEWDHCSHLL